MVKTEMKEYRTMLNLSQEELATRVGVRRKTIGNLEKGRYNPSLVLAWKIRRLHRRSLLCAGRTGISSISRVKSRLCSTKRHSLLLPTSPLRSCGSEGGIFIACAPFFSLIPLFPRLFPMQDAGAGASTCRGCLSEAKSQTGLP